MDTSLKLTIDKGREIEIKYQSPRGRLRHLEPYVDGEVAVQLLRDLCDDQNIQIWGVPPIGKQRGDCEVEKGNAVAQIPMEPVFIDGKINVVNLMMNFQRLVRWYKALPVVCEEIGFEQLKEFCDN